MNVPLLDLKIQYKSIKEDVDRRVQEVFESQYFVNGPQVRQCEEEIASYCNVPYATGVTSGTDAILISLMVSGIGAGDEVITSDYSFFATAGCIARSGATPVFVDIDPVTFNIDPAKIEEKITDRTRAIIPVHLYGQTADMDPILAIAKKYNLIVIEDAAQAIGAEYHGKRAGSMGDFGCFSFFPSKNLGTSGDGGIVTTNDKAKDELLKVYRNHGSHIKYYHKYIGGNFRLDSIHAAVVLAKLPHLDNWSTKRKLNADFYRKEFARHDLTGNGIIGLPEEVESRHIYNQFIVRVEKRDELRAFLLENGVGCEVYYPVPFHAQECFAYVSCNEDDYPESTRAANETIALPIYPELTDEQLSYVVETIRKFYQ